MFDFQSPVDSLTELETRQDEVLLALDDLNHQIERTLNETMVALHGALPMNQAGLG